MTTMNTSDKSDTKVNAQILRLNTAIEELKEYNYYGVDNMLEIYDAVSAIALVRYGLKLNRMSDLQNEA